jgi:hypothetical protein
VILAEALTAQRPGSEVLNERELGAGTACEPRAPVPTPEPTPDAPLGIPRKGRGVQAVARVAVELNHTRKTGGL